VEAVSLPFLGAVATLSITLLYCKFSLLYTVIIITWYINCADNKQDVIIMTAIKQPVQPTRLELQQKKRLNRAFIGCGIFFVGWVVAILSAVFDISNIGLTSVFIGVLICLITQVLLLYLFKTNKNLQYSDPNLTTVQLLNAIFWITISMVLMPQIEPVTDFV